MVISIYIFRKEFENYCIENVGGDTVKHKFKFLKYYDLLPSRQQKRHLG